MKAVVEEGYIRLQKVYDYIRELERKVSGSALRPQRDEGA